MPLCLRNEAKYARVECQQAAWRKQTIIAYFLNAKIAAEQKKTLSFLYSVSQKKWIRRRPKTFICCFLTPKAQIIKFSSAKNLNSSYIFVYFCFILAAIEAKIVLTSNRPSAARMAKGDAG